jgi:hypothetical protein
MNLYRWDDRQSCKNCDYAQIHYGHVVLCQHEMGILGTVDTWCGQWTKKEYSTATWHGNKQRNKLEEK